MKAYTIGLLLAALPALASAESYLCVDEQMTGFWFNTTKKIWEQSKFSPDRKYLVKPNSDQSVKGKWIVSEFGQTAPYAWSESDFSSIGVIRLKGDSGEFAMNRKNLRFVRTYIGGYWTDAIPGLKGVEWEESTPVISIGKCSVLEP